MKWNVGGERFDEFGTSAIAEGNWVPDNVIGGGAEHNVPTVEG